MTHLETLWQLVAHKHTREHPYVFEKHAFFVAAHHNGYGFTEIGRVSNHNHATVIYATKKHEQNLRDLPYYKERYDFFLNYNNLPERLEVVEDKIRKLLTRRRKLKNAYTHFKTL